MDGVRHEARGESGILADVRIGACRSADTAIKFPDCIGGKDIGRIEERRFPTGCRRIKKICSADVLGVIPTRTGEVARFGPNEGEVSQMREWFNDRTWSPATTTAASLLLSLGGRNARPLALKPFAVASTNQLALNPVWRARGSVLPLTGLVLSAKAG
ncbi:MAG: hypothetical protein OXI01_21005 [Albidovulum sp.]|nr:hypothetical protein [Albidovulum sp.]